LSSLHCKNKMCNDQC